MTGKMRFPNSESCGTKYPNDDLLACSMAIRWLELSCSCSAVVAAPDPPAAEEIAEEVADDETPP